MRHLVKAGILLLAVLLVVFVGLRVIHVPAFLEEFGFHLKNVEENEAMWASLQIQYVSSSICVNCHEDKYRMWEKGDHRTVSCENCHGPARAHVETGVPEVLDTSRGLCGLCHAQLVSRPSNFPQVNMTEMGGDEECITCHNPHEPRVGMPPQVPHTLEEGRTDCQLCHGSHEPWVESPPEYPHALEGHIECLSCHGTPEFRGATLPHIPEGLEASTDCLLCHSTGGIEPLPEDHTGRTSATCLNCHRVSEVEK